LLVFTLPKTNKVKLGILEIKLIKEVYHTFNSKTFRTRSFSEKLKQDQRFTDNLSQVILILDLWKKICEKSKTYTGVTFFRFVS